MTQHSWAKIAEVSIEAPSNAHISMIRMDWNVCENCGIPEFRKTRELPCPPWSSTGEGDTKTNRAHEVEGIKTLQARLDQLKDLTRVAREEGMSSIPVASIQMAIIGLEQVIQKREGLDRD